MALRRQPDQHRRSYIKERKQTIIASQPIIQPPPEIVQDSHYYVKVLVEEMQNNHLNKKKNSTCINLIPDDFCVDNEIIDIITFDENDLNIIEFSWEVSFDSAIIVHKIIDIIIEKSFLLASQRRISRVYDEIHQKNMFSLLCNMCLIENLPYDDAPFIDSGEDNQAQIPEFIIDNWAPKIMNTKKKVNSVQPAQTNPTNSAKKIQNKKSSPVKSNPSPVKEEYVPTIIKQKPEEISNEDKLIFEYHKELRKRHYENKILKEQLKKELLIEEEKKKQKENEEIQSKLNHKKILESGYEMNYDTDGSIIYYKRNEYEQIDVPDVFSLTFHYNENNNEQNSQHSKRSNESHIIFKENIQKIASKRNSQLKRESKILLDDNNTPKTENNFMKLPTLDMTGFTSIETQADKNWRFLMNVTRIKPQKQKNISLVSENWQENIIEMITPEKGVTVFQNDQIKRGEFSYLDSFNNENPSIRDVQFNDEIFNEDSLKNINFADKADIKNNLDSLFTAITDLLLNKAHVNGVFIDSVEKKKAMIYSSLNEAAHILGQGLNSTIYMNYIQKFKDLVSQNASFFQNYKFTPALYQTTLTDNRKDYKYNNLTNYSKATTSINFRKNNVMNQPKSIVKEKIHYMLHEKNTLALDDNANKKKEVVGNTEIMRGRADGQKQRISHSRERPFVISARKKSYDSTRNGSKAKTNDQKQMTITFNNIRFQELLVD